MFTATSIIGCGILFADVSRGAHYFACCFVAVGLYITLGIPLAWPPKNQLRYGKRALATGLQLTVGNSAGIMAPFVSLFLLRDFNTSLSDSVISSNLTKTR